MKRLNADIMADKDTDWLSDYTNSLESGWGSGPYGAIGRLQRQQNVSLRPPALDTRTSYGPTAPDAGSTSYSYAPSASESGGEIGRLLLVLLGLCAVALLAFGTYWFVSDFTAWPSWLANTLIVIAVLAAALPVLCVLALAAAVIGGIFVIVLWLIRITAILGVVALLGYCVFQIVRGMFGL